MIGTRCRLCKRVLDINEPHVAPYDSDFVWCSYLCWRQSLNEDSL